jgi:hypothetical protein
LTAGRILAKASAGAQGGCFAASAGSQQCQHFAFVDFKLDAINGHNVLKALEQVLNLDKCHRFLLLKQSFQGSARRGSGVSQLAAVSSV